jgi:hypothetical protein
MQLPEMQNPGLRERSRPALGNSLAKALWANCLVLVAILIAMLCRNGGTGMPNFSSAAFGQQMPIGGGAGVFIVPGQFSPNTWGCYLMDVDSQILCAYQFYPGDKQLRLVASRSFRYDHKLKEFNTTPSPDEVSELVAREQDSARVKEQNNVPANPETPAKPQ